MLRSITLILGLLFLYGSTNAQKENWVKLDLLRAFPYADIGVSYESRNETKGFKAQIVYIGDKEVIRDFSVFGNGPVDYNTLPRFEYKQQTLEIILSYKWYPKLSRKRNFYLGLVNINQIHLSLEDGYHEKYEEYIAHVQIALKLLKDSF